MKSKLLYERALITCVLMLIVSIILKLFGVPWFNLDTSIPILNKINDIVMNSIILSFIYSTVLTSINMALVVFITTKESNLKLFSKCVIASAIIVLFKGLVTNGIYSFLLETIVTFMLCLPYGNKGKMLKEYTLVFILNIVYQLISLFIRNITVQIQLYGLINSVLLNIDYYIMLVITYLWLKKGETNLCLIFRVYGSSLATKLWRKPTQDSNQCSSKES